eukprot:4568823-Pyramimonas_sp.AAC.1
MWNNYDDIRRRDARTDSGAEVTWNDAKVGLNAWFRGVERRAAKRSPTPGHARKSCQRRLKK